MATIEQSVEVDVPVRVAYNQWTQFEEFPRFMEGIEEVRQLSDTKLHWVAKVAGQHREWDAEVTEQVPDQRIAWRSVTGADNAGVVTFHRLSEGKSKVMLQLEFEPEGLVEQVGDKLGIVQLRAMEDLRRFRDFIERQGRESGGWRGEVRQTNS
jgi:uncharacterized membrane protein